MRYAKLVLLCLQHDSYLRIKIFDWSILVVSYMTVNGATMIIRHSFLMSNSMLLKILWVTTFFPFPSLPYPHQPPTPALLYYSNPKIKHFTATNWKTKSFLILVKSCSTDVPLKCSTERHLVWHISIGVICYKFFVLHIFTCFDVSSRVLNFFYSFFRELSLVILFFLLQDFSDLSVSHFCWVFLHALCSVYLLRFMLDAMENLSLLVECFGYATYAVQELLNLLCAAFVL